MFIGLCCLLAPQSIRALGDDMLSETLEAVQVCPSPESGCQQKSCLEMCLDEVVDPLDCSDYCNQSV
ncbi:MAG: hypothetical protein EB120_07385 [Proteobacteria bacterium]|nr:hypothetical protein [Pseudomonadota bacterium]NDG26980.1 hypothetical protein [Pseudomonadota bacterium]